MGKIKFGLCTACNKKGMHKARGIARDGYTIFKCRHCGTKVTYSSWVSGYSYGGK